MHAVLICYYTERFLLQIQFKKLVRIVTNSYMQWYNGIVWLILFWYQRHSQGTRWRGTVGGWTLAKFSTLLCVLHLQPPERSKSPRPGFCHKYSFSQCIKPCIFYLKIKKNVLFPDPTRSGRPTTGPSTPSFCQLSVCTPAAAAGLSCKNANELLNSFVTRGPITSLCTGTLSTLATPLGRLNTNTQISMLSPRISKQHACSMFIRHNIIQWLQTHEYATTLQLLYNVGL